MSEQAPIRIYEHQRILFDRVRAMPLHERLTQPVEVLPFAVRALAYCIKKNIKTLGELSAQRRRELDKVRNLGKKTIEHIEAYLNAVELGLDNRRRNQPEVSEDWYKGAEAMRKLILARLVRLKVDPDLRNEVHILPIPYPDERVA